MLGTKQNMGDDLKYLLQRLPIVLAQLKADSNLENLLNVIRQIVYSLYQNKLLKKYSIT